MTPNWRYWCWKLGLASLLGIGGAFATSFDCALAQIRPDGTLGAESSVVTPLAPSSTVNVLSGGARRGANLFHSFEQFSVPTGGTAYFNNALDIQNIISRVTGESISNIDGLIQANGTANLFVLNPNGIIFGPNASLNIGGSFLGSTASAINFTDGTQFSATAHPTTLLLTISIPIGLQYGGNAGIVQVQGNGQGTRTTTELIDNTVGLRVEPNQTLALVGGNVALSGGTLKTAGGRIELGSVAGAGLVNLTPTNTGWVLGYEGVPTFGDIQLSGQATVDASGARGGDIQVQGRRVTLTNGSQIEASTLGAEPGGTLNVTASESVEAIGTTADGQFSTGLFAQVYPGATGAGGNLTVETGRLIVQDGAQVSANNFGEGRGGTLAVKASDSVKLIGTTPDAQFISGLVNNTFGAEAAGDLTIETRQLIIQKGAYVSARTFDQGQGGNLTVTASDSVEIIGTAPDEQFPSGLFTRTEAGGSAGKLAIETKNLFIRDGAQVVAGAGDRSTGPGGNLTVTASESVEVIGQSLNGQTGSGLFSQTEGIGAAGDLTIATEKLIVRNGAYVRASTFAASRGSGGDLTVTASESVEVIGQSVDGQGSGLFSQTEGTGSAGDLTIATEKLIVRGGALVSAGAFAGSTGRGGDLTVTASESVELIGTEAEGRFTRGLITQSDGAGDAGDLTIETGKLIVQDGARISSATVGTGNSGDIRVNASNSVNLFGVGPFGFSSGLFTSTSGVGQGGNITVNTSAFQVADGAVISAKTIAEGNSGNITVNANTFEAVNGGQALSNTRSSGRAGNISLNVTDSVTLSGTDPTYADRLAEFGRDFVNNEGAASGLFANTAEGSTGDGGSISINPINLTITDGAGVGVDSLGRGNAGNLLVQAGSVTLDGGAFLSAETASSKGGDITLQVQDLLLLRRNSNISTTAGTIQAGGDGGNITIDTDLLVPLENSDITANAFSGRGGNIQITTQGLFLSPNTDITASSERGINGVVKINTPDIELSAGLATLPVELVDVSGLIAQGCPGGGGNVRRGASEFIVTGRGGLPPSPSEALRSDAVRVDLGTPIQGGENRALATIPTNPTRVSAITRIVEAQGWMINALGEVVLTAHVPTVTPHSPWGTSATCHAPKTSS